MAMATTQDPAARTALAEDGEVCEGVDGGGGERYGGGGGGGLGGAEHAGALEEMPVALHHVWPQLVEQTGLAQRLLPVSDMACKLTRLLKPAGMVPWRLFPLRSRLVRPTRLPSDEGMLPFSLLFRRLST